MLFTDLEWRSPLPPQGADGSVEATPAARREPSLAEVLAMFALMLAIHLLAVLRMGNFWERATPWFDRSDYLKIAATIRAWHSAGGPIPQHFWGFPYAIVAVSKLLWVPETAALTIVSLLASVAVLVLVYRCYGGWVAAVFIFLNYQWIVLSVEGGSEPLFICLLYMALLAARSNRWNVAALLASLGTTVRPVGVFALVALAAILVRRKQYRQLAIITLIGLGVGVLYLVPLKIILASPFANFILYRRFWGSRGWPLTYPFGALVPSYLFAFHVMRWPFFVFCLTWLIVCLVGTVAMCLPRHRLSAWPAEQLFGFLYLAFLFTYSCDEVCPSFDRFLLPVLPLLLFALRDWIPHDRRLLWGAAILSALLSASVVVSFRNVFGFALP
jgi:hypothetical protein